MAFYETTKLEFRVIIGLMLASVLIFATIALTKKSTPEPVEEVLTVYTECDSLRDLVNTQSIDIGRYEIILDRIYEKDSLIVNEASQNLE